MSGTNSDLDEREAQLRFLGEILDRKTDIDALGSLVHSLRAPAKQFERIKTTAIGLDANVVLRMGNRKYGVDLLDYFSARHIAPLILPGQVIQEFWNSQLSVVDSVAKNLERSVKALDAEIVKLEEDAPDFRSKMNLLLDEFREEHGFLYDDATMRNVQAGLEVLQQKALVPFVPRSRFKETAAIRKRTKTPPGFMDVADGDFFVWADFLSGLHAAQQSFENVVFVTNDVKKDWSRGGVAHPVLRAETNALCGKSFEVWTLDELHSAVKAHG